MQYCPEVIAELERMVAAALDNWQLPPSTALRLLNLSENATYLLSDPGSGRELVLRVHRIGYSSADEIRSELSWINALRRDGVVETAAPIAGRDGQLLQLLPSPCGRAARYAVAFERLSGQEPQASQNPERCFRHLGALTAGMHRHVKTWPVPVGFRRKRWDFEAMVGPHAHWGPWHAAIGLDESGRGVLDEALSCIRRRIERFGTHPDRFGLVHADLRLANLLLDGSRLRILDFDDCGFSWFMYDFAAAVSFIEHEPIVPSLLRAWCSGYRSQAPLSADDVAEIPTFIVLRRVLLTAWLASHNEIPFARQYGAEYTRGTVTLAQKFLNGSLLPCATVAVTSGTGPRI